MSVSMNIKTWTTTDFGLAAFLKLKGFEIERISQRDGILIKYPENVFMKDILDEYNRSDFKKFNYLLRDIIREFKNNE